MPSGEAAAKGMELAMQEAGLTPADIDYINAHGTSTGLNDKYETAAIKLAFGEKEARRVKISSTKSAQESACKNVNIFIQTNVNSRRIGCGWVFADCTDV